MIYVVVQGTHRFYIQRLPVVKELNLKEAWQFIKQLEGEGPVVD